MITTCVLVVEDDKHLLAGIRDILEMQKYKVLTAQNGHDGLAVLKADPKNPPNIIVSDIMMPRMDGYEFLEKVREEKDWVNVPFIFLTALGQPIDKRKGALMGADRYLTKPFETPDLLIAVKTSLKRSRDVMDAHEEKMQDQKKKIMAILNHEMRTPLTLIVAYAEMLKDFDASQTPEDEVVTFLKGVNSGADRLRRLIENFIYVVELDTDEAKKTIAWRRQPVQNFELLLKNSLQQINPSPCEFVMDVPPNLPDVLCDVQYITAVFRELLDNAAKFSKDDDKIHLKVSHESNDLVVRISDTGRGIADDELDNIWESFYQIDREQYEDQGSGSGLTIVRGIVELHGGSYEVDSVLGEGSTFTIRLPLE